MAQHQFPKRHHYIPEFYLKRWASSKGQVVEFSKPYADVVKPKRRYPKETGWLDRLYALEGLPEERAAVIESRFLSPVDSRAADVLAKMESGVAAFNGPERVAWAQFLMSLIFRHPSYIEAYMRQFTEAIFRISPDEERRYRQRRRDGEPRTLAEALKREYDADPAQVRRRAMLNIAEAMDNEKIGRHLINMRWGSYALPVQIPELLTSDRPVLWFGPLLAPDCHILMPIGPKRVFWAANTPEQAMAIRSHRYELLHEFMNNHVVRRALNFVYGRSDQFLPMVQDRMGVDPELTIPDMVMRGRQRVEKQRSRKRTRRRDV